jgi:DNA repair protein RadD
MKKVLSTSVEIKEGKKGIPMLVVSHECEGMKHPVREWVLLEHEGYGRKKAEEWWKHRASSEVPATCEEAMNRLNDIQSIISLTQVKDGNFWRVESVEFGVPALSGEQTSFESDDSEFF